MKASCPYCRGELLNSPALAGILVTCPHCRRPFTMPQLEEPIFAPVVTSSRSYRKPHKDNTIAIALGGVALAIVSIVVAVLMIDELRFWNAKRHVKEEMKEINRQFDKADREIKKASDDFERAMKRLND
jgi:uncharacterized membrane protein (DUF106 family)